MARFRLLRRAKIDGWDRVAGETIELSQSRGDWLERQGLVRALDPKPALLKQANAIRKNGRRCCGW